MRISDWSSDVCSSDLRPHRRAGLRPEDQRRHAGGGAKRPGRDPRLSRRRGGRGPASGDRPGPAAGDPVMLQIRGVHTYYGHIEALKGVDLDVKQGEIVTLIGANGAGKPQLLMTLCEIGSATCREREGRYV